MDAKINISLSFKQVIDIVKQLSPIEKQQLSEVLWTDQSIDEIVIPEEQKQIGWIHIRIQNESHYSFSRQHAFTFKYTM